MSTLSRARCLADAYVCLGRTSSAVGDLEGTHETLQKADRVAQQTKAKLWVLCWLDDCRLKAWLAEGNLGAATFGPKQRPGVGWAFQLPHDLHHLNLARVLVAQGILGGSRSSHEKATSLLARLRIAQRRRVG